MNPPAASAPAPGNSLASIRDIIRQFTPNWFTVTMGTGILALAINQLPFAHAMLHLLGEGLWMANILMFIAISGMYMARWILFRAEASRIMEHSVVSLFFGAIPMGLATIINGFLAFGIPLIGPVAVDIAFYLWWIDMVMAIACGIAIPYLMFTRQDHSIEKMTAVWLLPIVASEVAASSLALLIPHLPQTEMQIQLIIVGYMLWALSVPVAVGVLVILLMRLVLHSLPPKDMGPSSWLALGPIGTGAFGLLLFGADAQDCLHGTLGEVAHGVGIIGGAIFLGYGLWWLLMAAIMTARYLSEGMAFNLGWWGFTFPLGVYSVAIMALARQTNSTWLLWIGTFLILCLACFWVIVFFNTVKGVMRRSLFHSPCLVKGSIPSDLKSDMV